MSIFADKWIKMDVVQLDSIPTYCRLFGFATRHPLVAVVNCDEPDKLKPYMMHWGFYALFLKDMASCTITYGKTSYDHGDKSIIAFAPGQVCEFEAIHGKDPKFKGLLFHPDFIHGTALGREIARYNFFSYSSNEALHLSPSEFSVVSHLIEIMEIELENAGDAHTQSVLCDNIKLLLDYCVRFYDRQFTERRPLNHDVLLRFENLIADYLNSEKAKQHGVPTVNYFANQICLSPGYFGDLVRRETGVSAKEYLVSRILEKAKELLLVPDMSVSQVAEALGYEYPQHFVRFFKKQAGMTPSDFRKRLGSPVFSNR